MMAQSLNLVEIVDKQEATLWFFIPQFVGLVVFLLGGIAETSRPPFDLPEADTELVAGYHTEYSGMRWGLFQTAEYINMIVLSGLVRDALLRRLALPVRASRSTASGRSGSLLKLGPLVDRLHLAAREPAAPALRPADALRLEGAAAGRDRQRHHHRLLRGADLDEPVVPNTLKGFGVTLKQVFKKPITQQYPEYKRPVYPRFRGRHRLHLHENGLEKCVGCSLCAAACPADCIRVVAAENTADNRVSAGERYARIYEINMSRCIFCGYCELACPFDAITLGNEFEISEYNRDDLIYTKDMLLAPPIKTVPVADPDLYDTPIPYYKSNS